MDSNISGSGMNIALIGYGKMGKAIEQAALKKGHTVLLKIDIDTRGI